MSSSASKARSALRLLAGAFGVLLFTYLFHRAGPAKLLASIATLRWGLGLVLLWGGVAHILKAWAWRLTLLDESVTFHSRVSSAYGSLQKRSVNSADSRSCSVKVCVHRCWDQQCRSLPALPQ